MITTANRRQRYVYKGSCLVAGVSLLVLGSLEASAQAQNGEARQSVVLEEITVTARRIEENLQDTPVSMTALTPEGLERRQIINTEDLDDVAPNLSFSSGARFAANNNASVIYIRGIGQTTPTANVDPGVGVYIDDVYFSQSVGLSTELRDVESVQVLRGPQGTLFGRNTIGGAVLINTRDPDPTGGFSGTFRIGAGTDNLRDGFVAANLPMSDTFAVRMSFASRVQDGYVLRPFDGKKLGDTDNWTWTGKALWLPTPDLEIKLTGDYVHASENGAPYQNVEVNETSAFPRGISINAGCPGMASIAEPVPMVDDPRCVNDLLIGERGTNNGTHKTRSFLEAWGIGLHLDYTVTDAITLRSITAYRETDWFGGRDPDGTQYPILHTDYDSRGYQFSQELQMLYTARRVTGVVGAYYFKERVTDIVTVTLAPPPFPNGILDSDNNIVKNHNWAVFTQWTYDVTDALSVTLGGRYTEDTKGSIPDQFSYLAPEVKYLPVQLYQDTFTSFTPSASLSYHFTDTVMAYVSYAQGFKGGGWNSNFNTVIPQEILDALHKFDQEEAETFEAGFKADLFDRKLRINGAIFTTDYTDLQFTFRYQVAPLLTNAGKASIDGFELEMTWLPNEYITVDGALGYLHDSIDEITAPDIPELSTGVTEDSDIPYTPSWSANLGVGYRSDPGPFGLSFQPRVDVVYRDKQFFDAQNTPQIAQTDGELLLNASIFIENEAGDWRLQISGRNLTDEVYSVGGNSSLATGSGYAEAVFVRGREFFVNLSHDF